jgi:hypothetical protein
VVPGLEHDNVVPINEVDEAVFSVDASGPSALEDVTERFGFPDTAERFAKRVFEESIDPLDHRFVGTPPVQVVGPAMGSENQSHPYESS